MSKIIGLAMGLISMIVFADTGIQIETRELTIQQFPCMSCHGNINNDTPKFPLATPHQNLVFQHMKSVKNCYSCHDKADRDKLVLHNGEKITFNQSYLQCFQCHGEKKRDWELGIHGKVIGSWNGTKYKFVCVNCHEPHHPQFRKMKADPGPVHPRGKTPHSNETTHKGEH